MSKLLLENAVCRILYDNKIIYFHEYDLNNCLYFSIYS